MVAKYLGWRVSLITAAVVGVLVFVLWMSQSLRFIELLSAYHVPVGQFLALMLHMIPDLLGIVLPFAFVISVLWVLYQMIHHHEVIILRGAGLSDLQIAKGFLIAAGLWGCVIWGLQGYGAPWALKHFKTQEAAFKNMTPKRLMRPGEFMSAGQLTVYVGQCVRPYQWDKIFLHDTRGLEHVTIVAQKGSLNPLSQKAQVILENGIRQAWNPQTHQVHHLAFQRYTLDLELSSQKVLRTPKPFELSMTELFMPSGLIEQDPLHTRKMQIEGHQRILSTFYLWAMVLGGIVLVLKTPYTRHQEKRALGMGLGLAFLLEITYYGLMNLSVRWGPALFLAYGVAALSIGGALALLLRGRRSC